MANKKKKKKTNKPAAVQNKQVTVATETEVTENLAEDNVKAEVAAKPAEKKAPAKKAVHKNKKPNIFIRFGKKTREVFSELKKVTWPSFQTVLKQTGVVISVVCFFLVLIFGIDSGLLFLYGLIT